VLRAIEAADDALRASTGDRTDAMALTGSSPTTPDPPGQRPGTICLRLFGLSDRPEVVAFAAALDARPEIERLDLVEGDPRDVCFEIVASSADRIVEALYELREYRVAAVRSPECIEAHVQRIEAPEHRPVPPPAPDRSLLPPPRRFRLAGPEPIDDEGEQN
jgi:hypothetical protein